MSGWTCILVYLYSPFAFTRHVDDFDIDGCSHQANERHILKRDLLSFERTCILNSTIHLQELCRIELC